MDSEENFLTEIERAWRRAEDERDLSAQIKYALYRASGAALNPTLPPTVLAAAVQHYVLSPAQALLIVRQMPEEFRRGAGLVALSPHLLPPLLEQALETAL